MAMGYEGCNDAARLPSAPCCKWLVERSPIGDTDLASQSTLSRFENSLSEEPLERWTHWRAPSYAASRAVVARRV